MNHQKYSNHQLVFNARATPKNYFNALVKLRFYMLLPYETIYTLTVI